MAVVPGMTELTAPYWEAAREGRLVVQECRSCHQIWHPPLPRCPHCHSAPHHGDPSHGDPSHGTGLGWRELSGAGTVYTYTVVRHPTHFAFAGKIPYILAIVELAEGPRLVTALTGVEPDEVRGGQPVRVVFREVADGVTLPYFEPAAG
ncbi:MAG TPA: Zn-ribbon domain-containing OB-fold protein [Trebonia sp.]|nr:Zn-ribbon domain-containing OB-fold protein [Trebonia sp.]